MKLKLQICRETALCQNYCIKIIVLEDLFCAISTNDEGKTKSGEEVSLNKLWNRRTCTKFNGTPYITQRAAEATYTEEGKKQIKENINYYLENARIIREGLEKAGFKVGIPRAGIDGKTTNNIVNRGLHGNSLINYQKKQMLLERLEVDLDHMVKGILDLRLLILKKIQLKQLKE